ncbi:hypothetical protein B808_462 [Fructilactobacillus florum 8D]|uniref:Uncharacterized protein n=1 Tax=Fructilactobacillus florum 8D TaxID=1221538 RepID=W9EH75_9LACO|nr:hypothetical protein [Fructilactobacillus florum]EKK21194.1 hypothetical protein B807_67 [Fructilactobacillus florum 2F]ETO40616.1 hypothetical protein B808_462 [Fructilactobacillus florum 8D]
MWEKLNSKQKETYRKLITNFASLSEAFAQKEDESTNAIIAPIINSKYQETSFKNAFNATIEDIGNSSYDASINNGENSKYLVGIKAFGVKSGFQKIAQFKSSSQYENWDSIISGIKERSDNGKSKQDTRDYLKLAKRIAELRNKRINSSKSQLQGFDYTQDVASVYHVLMPSNTIKCPREGDEPYIMVGETSYLPIDISKIKILGPTNKKHLQNFRFTDGNHVYQYNSADSQLLMSFHANFNNKEEDNESIGVEKWSVKYIENAFEFFLNLPSVNISKSKNHVIQSFTFPIKTNRRSGFNEWFAGPKNPIRERNKKYLDLVKSGEAIFGVQSDWKKNIDFVLFGKFNSDTDKIKREDVRHRITEKSKPYKELFKKVVVALWRGEKPYEVYIPVPNAHKFNTKNPNFFADNAGILNGKKLESPVSKRTFTLQFLPSGEEMDMVLTQADGKAIQSVNSQYKFGKWVLKNIFQLNDWELLTDKVLDDLNINAMTFKKYDDGRPITLEFTYVDYQNLPNTFWQ